MIRGERFTITAALPYANGPLHIGHLAGAYLSADAYARFLRLMGKEVVFVCGSDEYGAAISIKAKKENTTPQAIVDKYHGMIRDSFSKLRISFDIYDRTSSELHAETAQDFFRKLYEQGEFQERESNQYYDESAEMFLADRFIVGTCPNCGNEEAYGDQCEHCGRTLSPEQLLNPVSTISSSKPILKSTKHWYLDLSRHQDWLKDWIKEGRLNEERVHYPQDWKKHVIGQCLSWLDGGLEPRSMTRDLDWGVDMPAEIDGSAGKKLYVWMDAPIGYISATKQWAKANNKDWRDYWYKDKSNLVHFIGKDNIVFHCIIFPAILKAHGGFTLPKNVPANQFMNLEGQKLSTSKGWAVWVHEYLEEFEGQEDVLRYVLSKNMPEQKDSEFTWAGFQEANNSDLVNNLGNFVNRVMVLTHKYYDGIVPEFNPDESFSTTESDDLPSWHDSELLDLYDLMGDYVQHMHEFDFRSALQTVMKLASRGNAILQANEPWKAQQEEPELVKVVMNIGVQYVGAISYACKPFMPSTSDRLRQMLNLASLLEQGDLVNMLDDLAEGISIIPSGHKIGEAEHLFSRIDDEKIQTQVDRLKSSVVREVQTPPEAIDSISFDYFNKLDIRTAKIMEATKVEKADKLLKIAVEVGDEVRTVVSGIAKFYEPEEIIGKEVVLLTNLEPRKIRGILSQGMILMAEDSSGKLTFISPPQDWPSGSSVR